MEIMIAYLADELAISESHLRLLFRREFNTSMGRYVRDVKMTRACHLLSTRNASISEIAAACGYETVYTFSRPNSWPWTRVCFDNGNRRIQFF